MSKTVSIDGMAEAINEGLQEYAKLASSEVKRAVRKSAKTVKEEIEAARHPGPVGISRAG